MDHESPFDHVSHRPWPLPRGPWCMVQRWHDLLFAHWPLPAAMVRPLIPAELELETFDDAAWIGVVPFRMSGVRFRALPPLPTAHAFPELNVRTYVRHGDKPGVWFFSLDAASSLAVAGARAGVCLPYYRAAMRMRRMDGINGMHDFAIGYASERQHRGAPDARFEAEYGPAAAALPWAPGSLWHWLTERYCLYSTDGRGRFWRTEVHHAPYVLHPARASIAANTMAAAAGITLPSTPPLLHFAPFQDVRVWWPLRIL